MADQYEAEVTTIVGVGPHPVRSDIYQIELEVAPAPGVPWRYVVLSFQPNETALLLKLLQATAPDARADNRLLDAIAGHDT